MKFVKSLGIVMGVFLMLGFLYQQWAEHRDAARFPPPGELVSVGDHRLHLWCAGHGSPTVLFVSGDGTPSVTMYAAQSRVSKFTTACSYDRAGLGWSDPPAKPMGLADQVRDLKEIVQRAHLATPLVLVPGSGGNVIALSFFDQFPASVAGMVMVDGSEPDLWFRGSPDEFSSMRMMDPIWQAGWRVGAIRLLLPFAVPQWVDALPANLRGQFDAVWSKPMPSYARDTLDRWEQTPVAMRPRVVAGALGSRPLIVIQHGRPGGMGVPEKYEPEWPAAQARLATLSRDSEMVIARDNHHPVAEENPELVSDQVERVVASVRLRQGFPR